MLTQHTSLPAVCNAVGEVEIGELDKLLLFEFGIALFVGEVPIEIETLERRDFDVDVVVDDEE
jgi:hypothetical protein